MKILYLKRDRKKIDKFLAQREREMCSAVSVVREIGLQIRTDGDRALLKYTKEFDGLTVKRVLQLRVTKREIKNAYSEIDADFLSALKLAKRNIESFHLKQKRGRKSWREEKGGKIIGEKYLPIERVGIYVPGGEASYPSTMLMNVIPARIAGVERIIVATPPSGDGKINPYTLAAAELAGAGSEIYKIGGAQAIFSMAFGTKTIAPVDKIVGPGNIYVSAAKLIVGLETNTGIDMIAGPTEIMIIADERANVRFVAGDMLSQIEHGAGALAILATTSEKLAKKISGKIKKQSIVIIVDNINSAIELANEIAPEHLELQVSRPWKCMERVKNAGAVFLGDYSPESLGDYLAGPNHVLPTGGRSKFSSALGIDTFLKRTNFVFSDRAFLKRSANAIIRLAECEGLDAHAEAVRIRMSL